MAGPAVALNNVTYAYSKKPVLTNIDLTISRGAFMGIIGPNGGGKSTLIKLILGLLQPDDGTIELFGKPIRKFRDWSKIGFVSQKANSFNKGFPATVFEVVSMGLTAKIGYLRFFGKEHKQKVLQAIEQVGMQEYVRDNIGNLSGGQQQRVFIARSLVSNPELLILDEPTVGVDKESVQQFYELLRQLNQKQQLTLILISHDTTTMVNQVSEIICLNKSLFFHGNPEAYISLSDRQMVEFYGYHTRADNN